MKSSDTARRRETSASRNGRRRSREFALQGLYQWQLAKTDPVTIAAEIAETEGYARGDEEYFRALLYGAIEEAQTLEQAIAPNLDRKFSELSPVERGVLLIAGYELLRRPDVPYRVVINEAVELAKSYGGTDGYKFVNGVLDKLAAQLRPWEERRTQ